MILRTKDLMALVETASDLTTNIDLQDLLSHILSKAGNLTISLDGSIILHNRQRNSLYFAAASGENAPMLLKDWGEFSEQQIPIKDSIAGSVFSTGTPVVEDAVRARRIHFKDVDAQTKRQTQSMICVPLTIFDPHKGETRLGVMQILNKQSGRIIPIVLDETNLERISYFLRAQQGIIVRKDQSLSDQFDSLFEFRSTA